jgi:hypothetical protein
MAKIRQAIVEILDDQQPMTVRQMFYALTVRGVIAKTEGEYHRTVVRLLTEMRHAGDIPFHYIADNTRWQRKPSTFYDLDSFLTTAASAYRRNLWEGSGVYLEVWLEKEALAGVVADVTARYDVPLMVSRGYSSVSFLHSAAETIEAYAKYDVPSHIYHFGDLDPSGVDIARDIERKLRRYAPSADIHFERVAVTRELALAWNLPTRPTKRTDSRARRFRGDSVELDAIPPDQLRDLVAGVIERHVDPEQVKVLLAAEESERKHLQRMIPYIRRPVS